MFIVASTRPAYSNKVQAMRLCQCQGAREGEAKFCRKQQQQQPDAKPVAKPQTGVKYFL